MPLPGRAPVYPKVLDLVTGPAEFQQVDGLFFLTEWFLFFSKRGILKGSHPDGGFGWGIGIVVIYLPSYPLWVSTCKSVETEMRVVWQVSNI